MASNYPSGYDDALPTAADLLVHEQDDPGFEHDVVHGAANDSVKAIQHELGLDPSGAAATLRARLDALDLSVAAGDAAATLRSNHSGQQLASTISDFAGAADARIALQKGVASGIAPLNASGLVPSAHLPSSIDAVQEYANLAAFPVTGTASVIYLALDTNKQYRWSGSTYLEINSGAVSSVNGKTGVIVLNADDIADGTTNHAFTAADDAKLGGVAAGATANATDAALRARSSHTGSQSADTVTDGTTNKAFLATERTKLSGVAAGATANATDAQLRDRASHTGTQPSSSISDFQEAARDALAAALVAGAGTTIVPDDSGDTITIGLAGSGGLPAGVVSTDGQTPVAGSLILDPETTTGWTAFNTTSALAVDTAFFTLGAASVKAGLKVSANTAYMRHNFAAPVAVGGHQYLGFDFLFVGSSGQSILTSDVLRINVSDAVDLGATKLSANFPNVAANQWVRIYIDVSSLATLRSFGITTDGGLVDDTVGAGMVCRIDNVRFADKTELDAALASSATVAVLVAAGYAPTGSQAFHNILAGQTVADFRPGSVNISRFRGERHLRDWLGIPEDGLTDISTQMQAVAGALTDGDKLVFPPKGYFWIDTMAVFRGISDLEIDLNGSTVFTRKYRGNLLGTEPPTPKNGKENNATDSIFRFENGQHIKLHNGRIFGSRPKTNTGAELTNYAGTPATVSTTKTLQALGDAVRSPDDNDGNTPFYARHPWVMFPTATRARLTAAYPSFKLGNAFDVTLSDSAQVAGDCVLEILADDDRSVVLATRTLTLTGTPTDYTIAFEPVELRRNFIINIRKATATANTITVTGMLRHGFCYFDDRHDSASAITSANVQDFLVENLLIEGAATDAIDGADANNSNHTYRGVTSRCANRQAFSANRGQGFVFEDCAGTEPARSGLDIEPYDRHWLVRGIAVLNCLFYNVTNSGIAAPNWANIEDLKVVGTEVHGCGEQVFNGGARGADIDISGSTSFKYGKYRTPGQTAATFNGQDMRIRGKLDGNTIVGSTYKLYQRPNAPSTTLTASMTTGDLTAAVASSAAFPATGGFLVDIGNEVLYVSAIAGTWTVARAQEGSLATTHSAGDVVTLLDKMYPDDNNVDVVLSSGTAIRDPLGRRNNVTQWSSGRPNPIVSTTAVTGVDSYPVRGRGSINKLFPGTFGEEVAPNTLWVPGGQDFNGQALSGVRGISSAGPSAGTLLTSAARTTGGTSTVIDLGARGLSGKLRFAVTAFSGTGTLDVTVEVSQDNTNWYPAKTLTVVTGFAEEFIPIHYAERYMRLTYAIFGSSPSFTCEADFNYRVPASNFTGVGTCLSGATSAAVAFAAASAPGSVFSASYASTTGGTLAPSTTYYFRLGTRTRLHGPKVWKAEVSATTGASGTAVNLTLVRWHNDAKLGLATLGFTLLVGTSPGVYTQRFDVLPKTNILGFSVRHDTSVWKYTGTSITPATNATGFPTTYPTPSPLLTVTDESANELDTAYGVLVAPFWPAGGAWVDETADLTVGGFTAHFPTAPGSNKGFRWEVVRG